LRGKFVACNIDKKSREEYDSRADKKYRREIMDIRREKKIEEGRRQGVGRKVMRGRPKNG
jgi:hypothetical protein